jgi:hypothetical protein
LKRLKKRGLTFVSGFNANARGELTVGPSACLLLSHCRECFGPLGRVVFRFAENRFECMKDQWDLMGEPDHASTIAKMNALGATAAGAVQLKETAEKALHLSRSHLSAKRRMSESTMQRLTPKHRSGVTSPNDARQRQHKH